LHWQTVSGSEFQTDGAATENARRTTSVPVLGTVNRGTESSDASDGTDCFDKKKCKCHKCAPCCIWM